LESTVRYLGIEAEEALEISEHKPGVLDAWVKLIEKKGVEAWARSTMGSRLGSSFPRERHEWWAKSMGRTPVSIQLRLRPDDTRLGRLR
jgi:hypothetical protein